MTSKELLAEFKEAPWKGPAELDALAASITELQLADVGKLLEIICSKGSMGDIARHRLRCVAFAKIAERAYVKARNKKEFEAVLQGAEPDPKEKPDRTARKTQVPAAPGTGQA